jgi:peptidoglycan hydrolase-like protein with peptidoglycan-binding domain
MKRTFVVLGLSAVLAMPLLAVGQQTTPGTSGGSGTRMEQQREQSGQQGMSQEQIREAQRHLKEAGFDPGPIDGQFGERTRAALREFQKARGLPQTGQLDEETRQQLMAQTPQESPGRMQSPRESSPGGSMPGGSMPGGSTSGGPTSGGRSAGEPAPGPSTPSGSGSGR